MTTMSKDARFIPLEQAARELGTTPLSVLMHIKRRLLTAEEQDGQWLVDAASLAALLAAGKGPAKSLCRSHCKSGSCQTCV